MNKYVISVLGQDRPGIIARISGALFEKKCNIENVSQTILQSEFSGLFIASVSAGETVETLRSFLQDSVTEMGLQVYVKPLEHSEESLTPADAEPFIITTRGPDRKGLVASITKIIAGYKANVTNLQAIFKGGDDPDDNIMIYEVDIPPETDIRAFDAALRSEAEALGLDISIQHRNIFEALNRI